MSAMTWLRATSSTMTARHGYSPAFRERTSSKRSGSRPSAAISMRSCRGPTGDVARDLPPSPCDKIAGLHVVGHARPRRRASCISSACCCRSAVAERRLGRILASMETVSPEGAFDQPRSDEAEIADLRTLHDHPALTFKFNILVARGGTPMMSLHRRTGMLQNASAGISIMLAAPAWMRARCAPVSGSIRSIKKRAVTSLAFMRTGSPSPAAIFRRAACTIRHHI